jgi:hypothetical protein
VVLFDFCVYPVMYYANISKAQSITNWFFEKLWLYQNKPMLYNINKVMQTGRKRRNRRCTFKVYWE